MFHHKEYKKIENIVQTTNIFLICNSSAFNVSNVKFIQIMHQVNFRNQWIVFNVWSVFMKLEDNL